MCELLALSANTPTDMRFSFRGLARRGGATGFHGDGWGLASFDPDGGGLHIYREQTAAAFSPVAAQLSELDLKSLYSLAHIRKATQGVVSIENCHPFHRIWQGQDWVFAHNGDIKTAIPAGNSYRPEGSTDSEAAFCWMLNELSNAFSEPADGSSLFPLLNTYSAALAAQGIFNCLISNGDWLYAYCGTRLHTITRRAPFTEATLADDDVTVDFSAVTTIHDVVTIVSTEPLTSNEQWRQLVPGESLLLQRGEVMQRQLAHQPTDSTPG
ncbi:MAG: class II glutamine amidotransferase [Synechococcaceae bacterium WB9_2_170]|nr:class II glutamine amidotransferase [Synechococcaceae bacterium WB9_2_170]